MKIVVGGDHAGYLMKGPAIKALERWEHEVTDLGVHTATEEPTSPTSRNWCVTRSELDEQTKA